MYKYRILILMQIVNISTYCEIRRLIWTIVKIDISKKKKKQYDFRQEIKKESIFKRLDMRYLDKYVITCKKDFDLWIRIKNIYIVIEIVVTLIYLLALCNSKDMDFFENIERFFIIQCGIWWFFICYQFRHGYSYRESKYESIKSIKRNKKE